MSDLIEELMQQLTARTARIQSLEAERAALAAELAEWKRMRNEAMAVATANREWVTALEARIVDAETAIRAKIGDDSEYWLRWMPVMTAPETDSAHE